MVKSFLRFKYIKNGTCWECVSHKFDVAGYPRCQGYDKTNMTAHRYVYFLTNGKISRSKVIRHSCDNRKCINPDHLLIGTIADNNKDKSIRGRSNRKPVTNGEINGMSKLTKSKVIKILSLKDKLTSYEIAKKFNMSQSHISGIHNRRFWKHIGGTP